MFVGVSVIKSKAHDVDGFCICYVFLDTKMKVVLLTLKQLTDPVFFHRKMVIESQFRASVAALGVSTTIYRPVSSANKWIVNTLSLTVIV